MPRRLEVWEGQNKRSLGCPGLSYLGSLNAFQIKTKGLPWTRSRKGLVFQEICSLASPPPTGGKASPWNRAWQPPQQPQLVALFTVPAKQTLAAPLGGPGAFIHLQRLPPPPAPRENSSPNTAVREAGREGLASPSVCRNWDLRMPTRHSSKWKASLCQRTSQPPSPSLPSD